MQSIKTNNTKVSLNARDKSPPSRALYSRERLPLSLCIRWTLTRKRYATKSIRYSIFTHISILDLSFKGELHGQSLILHCVTGNHSKELSHLNQVMSKILDQNLIHQGVLIFLSTKQTILHLCFLNWHIIYHLKSYRHTNT